MKHNNGVMIICVFLIFQFCPMIGNVQGKIILKVKDPILFLHDHEKTGNDWTLMKSRFIKDGWPKSYLSAPTIPNHLNCTSEANIVQASFVTGWVNELLKQTGAEKVVIIGHSVGGIIGRYYLKFLNGTDKVSAFVGLGVPNHGNNINPTCYKPDSPILLKLNEGDETPKGILVDKIGQRNDVFDYVTYNGTHVPGSVNYTSIYSQGENGFPYLSASLEGAANLNLSIAITHYGWYLNLYAYKAVKDYLINVTGSAYYTSQNSKTKFEFLSSISISLGLLVFMRKRRINYSTTSNFAR